MRVARSVSAIALAGALLACSSSSSPTPSGGGGGGGGGVTFTPSGTFTALPLVAAGAFATTAPVNDVKVKKTMFIGIGDRPITCANPSAANTTTLTFELALDSDPAPGTFAVKPQVFPGGANFAPGNAGVMIYKLGMNCSLGGPNVYAAISGTVTIEQVDESSVSGKVDVVLEKDAGTLTGPFRVGRCAPQQGTGECTP